MPVIANPINNPSWLTFFTTPQGPRYLTRYDFAGVYSFLP